MLTWAFSVPIGPDEDTDRMCPPYARMLPWMPAEFGADSPPTMIERIEQLGGITPGSGASGCPAMTSPKMPSRHTMRWMA